MCSAPPSLDVGDARTSLDRLLASCIDTVPFQSGLRQLHDRFRVYAATSPAPLPASGLIVSPEIRYQSELYLPIAEIRAVFNRLYRSALVTPPILSSTPFHGALSWADAFLALPGRFRFSANPAELLETLLSDRGLLTEFLFASFLPQRFYGGFGRYPGQQAFVMEWLDGRNAKTVRCLDAACGTGEDTYGLARMLMEQGYAADDIRVEGWTIEALEVWAATHGCFPHDRQRELLFRKNISQLFERGNHDCIRFRCMDIVKGEGVDGTSLHFPEDGRQGAGVRDAFDLICCNGLLGGPIINELQELEQLVDNLSRLLAPGGVLLAADHFHEGWKQKCPQENLQALLEHHNLKVVMAGEGLAGLKPDQQSSP